MAHVRIVRWIFASAFRRYVVFACKVAISAYVASRLFWKGREAKKDTKKSRKCQTRSRFEFLNLNRWKKSIIWESLLLCSGQNGHSRNLVPPTRSQLIRLFSILPLRFYLDRTQRARRSKRKERCSSPHPNVGFAPPPLLFLWVISCIFCGKGAGVSSPQRRRHGIRLVTHKVTTPRVGGYYST